MIFVFGSNLSGWHKRGAALTARVRYGAIDGMGEGLFGRSYAIPTKDRHLVALPEETIEEYVATFKLVAASMPDIKFRVTAIGTGYAGFSHFEIAPMFRDSPLNCEFDARWAPYLGSGYEYRLV